ILGRRKRTEFRRQRLAFGIGGFNRLARRAGGGKRTHQTQPDEEGFPQTAHLARRASERICEICRTKHAFVFCRTSAGTSPQSLRFCSGRMTRLIPARFAARTFSLMPPTGSTRPRKLISPVIAVSERTSRCVSKEASAATIVTPALGPS